MANQQQTDLATILTTDHPSRPYFILGGLMAGIGLFRSSLGGMLMLGVGGALIKRGIDEMDRINKLHGGNYHGVNSPPSNR
jgi:uncharacterized membrane protein